MFHCLQNCTDVLEAVHDSCTELCVAACDVEVEEDSDMAEEEDPLALTLPTAEEEQEVCYVPCTYCCPEPLGLR
jgi:hypothetical protein